MVSVRSNHIDQNVDYRVRDIEMMERTSGVIRYPYSSSPPLWASAPGVLAQFQFLAIGTRHTEPRSDPTTHCILPQTSGTEVVAYLPERELLAPFDGRSLSLQILEL